MLITQNGLFATSIAFADAAGLPVCGLPRAVVKLTGAAFTTDIAAEADADWVEACVTSSWQIDRNAFGGFTLIRHPMTGLTYVVFFDEADRIEVKQVDAACCDCNEALDPGFIAGHAARRVVEAAFKNFTDWQREHDGPVYLVFPWRTERDPPRPTMLEPESVSARGIRVRPVVVHSERSPP